MRPLPLTAVVLFTIVTLPLFDMSGPTSHTVPAHLLEAGVLTQCQYDALDPGTTQSLSSADVMVVYGALTVIRHGLRDRTLTPAQEAMFCDSNAIKAVAAQIADANAGTQLTPPLATGQQDPPPQVVLTYLIHAGLMSKEEYGKLWCAAKSSLASTNPHTVHGALATVAGVLHVTRKSFTDSQEAVFLDVAPDGLADRIARANIDPHDMTYLTGAVIMSPAVKQEAGSLASYEEAATTIQVGSLSEGTHPGTDGAAENFTFLTAMSDRAAAGVYTTAVLGASGAGKSIFCAHGLLPRIQRSKSALPRGAVCLTVMMRCREVAFEGRGLRQFILSLLGSYVTGQKRPALTAEQTKKLFLLVVLDEAGTLPNSSDTWLAAQAATLVDAFGGVHTTLAGTLLDVHLQAVSSATPAFRKIRMLPWTRAAFDAYVTHRLPPSTRPMAKSVVAALFRNRVLRMLTTNARAASYLFESLTAGGYFSQEPSTARLIGRAETSWLVTDVAYRYCGVNGLRQLPSRKVRRCVAAAALRCLMFRGDDPTTPLTAVEELLVKLGVVEYNVDAAMGAERCKHDPSLPSLTVSPALLLVLLHLLQFPFDLAFDGWRGIESLAGIYAALKGAIDSVPPNVDVPTSGASADVASIAPEFSVPSPLLVQWRSPAPPTRARRDYRVKIQVARDESAHAPAAYMNGLAAPFADVIGPWLLIQGKQAAADAADHKVVSLDAELTKSGLSKDSGGSADKVKNAQNVLSGLVARWRALDIRSGGDCRRLYPLTHFLPPGATGPLTCTASLKRTALDDWHFEVDDGTDAQSDEEEGDGSAKEIGNDAPECNKDSGRRDSDGQALGGMPIKTPLTCVDETRLRSIVGTAASSSSATTPPRQSSRLTFALMLEGKCEVKAGPCEMRVAAGDVQVIASAQRSADASPWEVAPGPNQDDLSRWLAGFLREDLHGVGAVAVMVMCVRYRLEPSQRATTSGGWKRVSRAAPDEIVDQPASRRVF